MKPIFENSSALQNLNIIWLSNWSEATLNEIPKMLINKYFYHLFFFVVNCLNFSFSRANKLNKSDTIEDCEGFVQILKAIEPKLSTPLRFIYFIETYKHIYSTKKKKISSRQNKLSAGVTKLTEARNVVTDLKQKALEQQEKLAEKQSMANNALDMISNTMKNANVHKEEMESLKIRTEKENQQLIKRLKISYFSNIKRFLIK